MVVPARSIQSLYYIGKGSTLSIAVLNSRLVTLRTAVRCGSEPCHPGTVGQVLLFSVFCFLGKVVPVRE